MIKKAVLGIVFLGILLIPAYASDTSGKHCKNSDECHAKCTKAVKVHAAKAKPATTGREIVVKMKRPLNPLDREAKKFVMNDVKRIAILPFSDYSEISPVESQSKLYWASRRIHDFLTAEFIQMGKMVVPYDNMVAALAEIRGINLSRKSGMEFLQDQLVGMSLDPETQGMVFESVSKMMPRQRVVSLDLTATEIRKLGIALNVDAVIMGSISDYGETRYIKPDARTFIPPFLGVWNPSKKAQIRMLVYMYDTKTGELIWESMEETHYEPLFPLFSKGSMNFEKLNKDLAKCVVDHFRKVQVVVHEVHEGYDPFSGRGETRREKDVRIIIKQE